MKNRLIVILILVISLLNTSVTHAQNSEFQMKGIWVASVLNIDYPRHATTNSVVLKMEADSLVAMAKKNGFNAIFLQVRPTADSLYKSKIFPWSKWLTGTEGLQPDSEFDPLQYFIDAAHNEGIELHAWINPYRITKKTKSEKPYTLDMLSFAHPARRMPESVISYKGNLYFDPSSESARKLICDGVAEIVENYDVDGIHFDDYFYPARDFDDKKSFDNYKGDLSLEDWRRNNVNLLIADVKSTVKSIDENVSFGISPFGIWANKSSNPSGSDTKGNESYSSHYADSVYWINNSLVDYICPQVYWHIGFDVADFKVLTDWWSNLVSKNPNVKLYIGIAGYKADNKDVKSPWYKGGELKRQLSYCSKKREVDGYIVFNATSVKSSKNILDVFSQDSILNNRFNINKPSISFPDFNKTTLSSVYIGGVVEPNVPAYFNGKEIKKISKNGYFGVFTKLNMGNNYFKLVQGNKSVTKNIVRYKSAYKPMYLKEYRLVEDSLYPQHTQLLRYGDKIKLSCFGPSGFKVIAVIGDTEVALSPSNNEGKSLLSTSYSAEFLPNYKSLDSEFLMYNYIEYKLMYGNDVLDINKSKAGIVYAKNEKPFFVRVKSDDVNLRVDSNPRNGSAEKVHKDYIDEVEKMSGTMAHLSSGRFVELEKVELLSKSSIRRFIDYASYRVGPDVDTVFFKLNTNEKFFMKPSLDKGNLILDISDEVDLRPFKTQNSGIIKSVFIESASGRNSYILKLNDNDEIGGYWIDQRGNFLILNILRKKHIISGSQPLKGISVMVDAGHGGDDSGALGLLGTVYAEKHINLDVSLSLKEQLEKLGATVILTRDDDATVSLDDRLKAVYKYRPDLFISIHANSIAYGKNADFNKGFSVYYSKDIAEKFASAVQHEIPKTTVCIDNKLRTNDFYVIRATHCPSVLLELGFLPNPDEFDWLSNHDTQRDIAKELSKVVMLYFENGGF